MHRVLSKASSQSLLDNQFRKSSVQETAEVH